MVVRFSIDILTLVVNTSASFRVVTFDIDGSSIDTTTVILSGDAYSNWGTNDDYVIQYIANVLGFTLVPPLEKVETN